MYIHSHLCTPTPVPHGYHTHTCTRMHYTNTCNQSVTNHTHPAHTPTQVHACTHVHSHPCGATSGTRADTVHTVNTPTHDPLCTTLHTCAQELMPAHRQAALLGSLIFWQSENTSGYQTVTVSNHVPAAASADTFPVLGQLSRHGAVSATQWSGTWF